MQRLNEELKLLNEELAKSDLDPRLVKVMQQQVKELENLRDEVTKVDNKLPKSEQERALFYQQVAELDPDAVDEEITKKIAEDFDKIIKV
jgi:recombinational DNA repair ATPase RecF